MNYKNANVYEETKNVKS